MNKTATRLTAMLAAVLTVLALAAGAMAETAVEPLPLDMTFHGYPPKKDGWISKTEYQDPSIHAVMYTAQRKPKSSAAKVTCRWIVIRIADPTQIRTTFSFED